MLWFPLRLRVDFPVEAFKKLSYPLGAIGKRPETGGI